MDFLEGLKGRYPFKSNYEKLVKDLLHNKYAKTKMFYILILSVYFYGSLYPILGDAQTL